MKRNAIVVMICTPLIIATYWLYYYNDVFSFSYVVLVVCCNIRIRESP